MNEMMSKEEWNKWFIAHTLPYPHNEWGISKEEFKWVRGWNDCRATVLQRLVDDIEREEVKG